MSESTDITEIRTAVRQLCAQYGEDYFKQLTAEKRIIRVHRGYPRAVWEKAPTRNNEALDCRVYARAAAWIAGADRWSDAHWRELERHVAAPDHEEQAAPAHAAPRAVARRRTVQSSYMR